MPRSGGVYTAPSNSWNPAVEGTAIEETDWNAILADMTAAFTASTYTDGLGSTDNQLVRTDGTDARKVQGTGITVDDSNNMSGVAALSATTLELGHASDTTLARASAGDVQVEGNLIYRAGGTDVPIADGGTGASTAAAGFRALAEGISTTQGAVMYRDGSQWVGLAPGSSGQFLKTQGAGANPMWDNPAGSGDVTGPASSVAGDVVLFNGTTGKIIKRLAAGTSGQFLRSNGSGVDPSWDNPAGSGDVTAASSFGTDNRLIRSDGTGKGVQSTGLTVDDSDNLTGVTSVNSGPLAGFRNVLINGGMAINQRQASSNADDTFAHDRWNILTQTGTVAASTQTLIENGWTHAMRITQSQASAQRFGVEQMVEAVASQFMRGSAVTLSARVRMSASTTLRYAVLEWTGTADTITSDVVNDWTSATFTAGNFFLASNLTVTATGSAALTANTAATVSLSTTLGSSGNNVIVLFWTDSTQAQNVTLDIGNVQLEIGSKATPFERRPFGTEIALCQRYFFKSYEPNTAPGSASTTTGQFSHRDVGTTTVEKGFLALRTPVPMRATPTVTWYSPETGTAARIRHNSGSADAVVNSTSGPSSMSTGHPVLAAGAGAVNDLWTAHVTLAIEL